MVDCVNGNSQGYVSCSVAMKEAVYSKLKAKRKRYIAIKYYIGSILITVDL